MGVWGVRWGVGVAWEWQQAWVGKPDIAPQATGSSVREGPVHGRDICSVGDGMVLPTLPGAAKHSSHVWQNLKGRITVWHAPLCAPTHTVHAGLLARKKQRTSTPVATRASAVTGGGGRSGCCACISTRGRGVGVEHQVGRG